MEQLLEICRHLSSISDIPCRLLNVSEQHFCPKQAMNDTMILLHCKSCAEAYRRNDIFQYKTSDGYHFLAAPMPLYDPIKSFGIIIGPFVSKNTGKEWMGIPVLSKEKLQSMCMIVKTMSQNIGQNNPMEEQDFCLQEEVIHTMGMYAENDAYDFYPVQDERHLQQLIRIGDKKGAQKLLNVILLQIYSVAGTNLLHLKTRTREIITLMSRAAADSGADINILLFYCDESLQKIAQARDFDELDTLLSELLHQFMDLAFEHDSAKYQYVTRKVSVYVEQHLSEKMSLEDVANSVPVSKSYLCRILKQEWECTFTEYVNKLRVERSKYLLHTSKASLSQIAAMTGFEDQSYFNRIFKRYVGETPGQYRSNFIHV